MLTRLEEFALSDRTAYYDRRPGGGMEKGSDTTEGSPDKEDPTSGSGDDDPAGEDSVPASGDSGSQEEAAAPNADAAGPDMEEASSESAAEEEVEFDDGINNSA